MIAVIRDPVINTETWKEMEMNRSGRFDWGSAFATGIKAAAVLSVVALVAAFTTSAPLPTGEVALVPVYVAVQQPGVGAPQRAPQALAHADGKAGTQ
jgi:hypothetical protein